MQYFRVGLVGTQGNVIHLGLLQEFGASQSLFFGGHAHADARVFVRRIHEVTFPCFCIREFGEDSFKVERVDAASKPRPTTERS